RCLGNYYSRGTRHLVRARYRHVIQALFDVSNCHVQRSRPGGLTVHLLNEIHVSGQVSQTRLSFKAPQHRFQPPHIQ
ncbi:unnamed protein product, partial [Closterium sp. Naga37s-1]